MSKRQNDLWLHRGSRKSILRRRERSSGALVEARAPADATLLEQGQPNDHLTFLIEGTADIVRISRNGRRDVITHLTAPAMFGTTSFFQPKPPTVRCRPRRRFGLLSLYHPAHEALRGDQSPSCRSTRPGGRACAFGTVRFDRQALHGIYDAAFGRAREKERMGGVSCPPVRGAGHLGDVVQARRSANKSRSCAIVRNLGDQTDVGLRSSRPRGALRG